ncbi:phosphatidylinositol 4-phosphate 5-kinase-like protein 1 isoform X2 [Gouania willdenowi]|uniref:phosphatidylinositol 4-phosphate 5-kinase-like protein 1 isoform X2 n=1 Tax=Gouania willdenowi TaxID=441366 RepID=UPI001056CB54|nr:phosphatidylinositol 4-phosphate 5-kinase-like protein 1 isoform X2 [Gouania willdenowi]
MQQKQGARTHTHTHTHTQKRHIHSVGELLYYASLSSPDKEKIAEMEEEITSPTNRRRRWWHLRQRWKMLGVFEINPEHEFFYLTSVIKEGMQAAIQSSMDSPIQETLTEEHFKAEETQTHTGFEMQTFAAPVFSKVRRSLDMSEAEYMSSICSVGCYLQFVSNSKSRADFFVTNDRRFFLKTQSEREVRFLLTNLHRYIEHLEKYPHSLLVRFLGVHRILVPGRLKKYFLVMQSVFYPDERIKSRYDIKGCEVGRWTDPETEGQHIIKILKDNNFKGQHIELGGEKSWFERQVEVDTAFLRSLNVLDYSLLLGHQPLHRDEQDRKHSLANLVIRTKKSLHFDEHESGVPLLKPPTDCNDGSTRPQPSSEEIPLQEIRHPVRSDSELRDFHEHHRRLLPDAKNAVHVIDGPQLRYFVGIIDIFTVYGCRKRLENLWKRLRYPGRAFSTVSPNKYCQRFCRWIQEHTE